MMRRIALAAVACLLGWQAHAATRIKDIIPVQGVRANQLVGYGLVIGLNGTGDTPAQLALHRAVAAVDARSHGHQRAQRQQRTRNIAAVIVTADLPAFCGGLAHRRHRLLARRRDVAGGRHADADAADGGADGQIYAVGQGPLAVYGLRRRRARPRTLTQGVPTAGRIPNGALVEREVRADSATRRRSSLELRNPDFNTAVSVADAINAYTAQRFGIKVARENDLRTIAINGPFFVSATRFLAEIGELVVRDRRARARRHRRAHRHHRHRQGRPDLARSRSRTAI